MTKVLKKIKKRIDHNRLVQFVVNINAKHVRREMLEGRPHLVAPVVLMTEGVHTGSQGALYYPASELDKWAPAWNHKPITVYHPEEGSGSDPVVLNSQKVGVVLNTEYDDKQRAEAWFDEERTKALEPRIINALKKKKMMEVSTGLLVDREGGEGEFNGKKFKFTAVNHRPDHLAILPDKIGACSIKDGGGLLQLNERRRKSEQKAKDKRSGEVKNEMSFSAIERELRSAMLSKYGKKGVGLAENGWNGWIEEVWDSSFVYSQNGKTFKQKYMVDDPEVTLVDDPTEVKRKVSYVPIAKNESDPECPMASELVAENAWSDSARQASADSRRRGARGPKRLMKKPRRMGGRKKRTAQLGVSKKDLKDIRERREQRKKDRELMSRELETFDVKDKGKTYTFAWPKKVGNSASQKMKQFLAAQGK